MKKDYSYKLSLMEDIRWWSVARRRIIEHVLRRQKFTGNIDILEIGCGTGGNLGLLSRFGNVYAMDSDAYALKIAADKQIGTVEKGRLPNSIPFGSKKFDLILMLDVLEHINDELSSLNCVRKRLKDNGKLLLTVPAYPFMWSRIDIDSGHKRRYIKIPFNKIIQRAGYEVEYSTYFNTFLLPLIGMIRIINKIRGRHDNLDLKIPSPFTNALLIKIFSAETIIIPKLSMPFGVSILTLASTDR